MRIELPELSLVVMVGASASGKSSFARKWFNPTEIVSSDQCRALVSNDENSMDASADAFDLLYYLVGKRLKRGLLTVVDATNVRPEDRKRLVEIAREYHVLPTAIVLNMPEKVCVDRNSKRTDRDMPARVVVSHCTQLRRGLGKIKYEGFRKVYEFQRAEVVESVEAIERQPLWNNKKDVRGPFDIIGDIHGCYSELCALLTQLGHTVDEQAHTVCVSGGRKLIFLGDLVDRGPASPAVLRLVMNAVAASDALCVPGNHDVKLMKYLDGRAVQISHGLAETVAQIEPESEAFREEVKKFIDSLISHYVLDDGKLVVAHAGLRENMQGRGSGAVREFCLYGETTGETDEFGLPIRYNWAAEYKGAAMVVYGHTPVPEAQWFNNTIDIDTGCVFGGKLSALRYPERELFSVPAMRTYAEPVRPLITPETARDLQHEYDDTLDIEEALGRQVIETRLGGHITIREGNSAAALEAMSRFGLDPKWLIYLPPTMSPAETSDLPDHLEYPTEAFSYFRKSGITQVVCEEKHMGSRAIVVVCKDETVAERRFGIAGTKQGVCYTRTGRSFFADDETETAFIHSIQSTLHENGFWQRFDTDWVCLDGELMPWSAKARTLLQHQYAATASAATHALGAVCDTLAKSAAIEGVDALLQRYKERKEANELFADAYRRYCWDVTTLSDHKYAPFHIMATEGRTYFDKDHAWHMEQLAALCAGDNNLLIATNHRQVDLNDEQQVADAISWWTELTARGGEGMVVKPLSFIARGPKGGVQPAIKIRGREYLRIIYGSEYTMAGNMVRLRNRGLNIKRNLAMREFALGVEGLERFTRREPLRRVHQCVLGVLAMESEAVDPRL